MNFENHITAGVAYSMIWMRSKVVEKTPGGSDSASCRLCLGGRDIIASREDKGVLDAGVIKEVAVDLLDP